MPAERPRYLMGVGRPQDLLVGIAAGIDMFDCVMPTRNARNGHLFVPRGHLNIANTSHRDDPLPIDEGCACEACRRYSRATCRIYSDPRKSFIIGWLHYITFSIT
jgi:queuine tRNA-ribosyltransferase